MFKLVSENLVACYEGVYSVGCTLNTKLRFSLEIQFCLHTRRDEREVVRKPNYLMQLHVPTMVTVARCSLFTAGCQRAGLPTRSPARNFIFPGKGVVVLHLGWQKPDTSDLIAWVRNVDNPAAGRGRVRERPAPLLAAPLRLSYQ